MLAPGRSEAPLAAASARRRRKSRRSKLLVDGRGRVEEQRDQVLDLLLGERAGEAQARHLRARAIRLGVVDLAVDVALHVLAGAALLAEAEQARSDGAVGELRGREPVAVVAAAAGRLARLVGPLHAAAVLRQALAALPVAHQPALREGDGLHLLGLYGFRHVGRRMVVRLGADLLQAILHDAVHAGLAARMEVALQDFLNSRSSRVPRGGNGPKHEKSKETRHLLLPGPR